MEDWKTTGIYRYEIINAENERVRFISVSGNTTGIRYKAIADKLSFLFGEPSIFLTARIVTEEYYQQMKEKQ